VEGERKKFMAFETLEKKPLLKDKFKAITPAGVKFEGGTPDQAKMASTPAQKRGAIDLARSQYQAAEAPTEEQLKKQQATTTLKNMGTFVERAKGLAQQRLEERQLKAGTQQKQATLSQQQLQELGVAPADQLAYLDAGTQAASGLQQAIAAAPTVKPMEEIDIANLQLNLEGKLPAGVDFNKFVIHLILSIEF